MTKAQQDDENNVSIVIEIGEPGQTLIPITMMECLALSEQQQVRNMEEQKGMSLAI